MKHGSLFSGGCDGFSLAAEWAGWQTIFQVEKNEHRRKILAKNFPQTKRYSDICEFNAKPYRGAVDIISGGFPCQPFSVAGKRKGKADDRYLWPQMLRVIKEIKPAWVVGENVAAITKMVLDEVLSDLEAIGYTTEAYIIPACAVNAPHRRNRVWIIAHTNHAKAPRHRKNSRSLLSITESKGSGIGYRAAPNTNSKYINLSIQQWGQNETKNINTERENSNATDTSTSSRQRKNGRQILSITETERFDNNWESNWLEVATELCGVDDGIPHRVDRIASCGDAIVPQIAYEIFEAINQYTKNETN